MFSQFFSAIGSFGQALPYLTRKGFKRFLVLPIIINSLLLTFAIWASVVYGESLTNYLLGLFLDESSSLSKYLGWIVAAVLRISILMIYFSFFRYILLILLSPFLSFLSEKVDRYENGGDFPFSLKQLGNDIIRAIRINLRNLGIELILTIALSLVTFIPLVGLLSPFAILMVQSYFFGFAMMDYNAERYRWTLKETSSWMKKNFAAVTGIGLAFHLCFLVPVAGWIIAPVLATVAGTLTFFRLR